MCENTDSRCTTTATVRGTRLAGGSSRFLLPTFLCGRQRKVGAAPHRGNANRPPRNQGKANAASKQKQAPSRQKSSRRRNRHLIPKPTNSLNPNFRHILRKLAPQSGHDKIDTRRINILLLRPGIPDQLIPRHRRINLPQQALKQKKLPPCNGNPPPTTNKFPSRGIQSRPTHRGQKRSRDRSGSRPAQSPPGAPTPYPLQSGHPLMHFNKRIRLTKTRIRAGAQDLGAILSRSRPEHSDNRRTAPSSGKLPNKPLQGSIRPNLKHHQHNRIERFLRSKKNPIPQIIGPLQTVGALLQRLEQPCSFRMRRSNEQNAHSPPRHDKKSTPTHANVLDQHSMEILAPGSALPIFIVKSCTRITAETILKPSPDPLRCRVLSPR